MLQPHASLLSSATINQCNCHPITIKLTYIAPPCTSTSTKQRLKNLKCHLLFGVDFDEQLYFAALPLDIRYSVGSVDWMKLNQINHRVNKLHVPPIRRPPIRRTTTLLKPQTMLPAQTTPPNVYQKPHRPSPAQTKWEKTPLTHRTTQLARSVKTERNFHAFVTKSITLEWREWVAAQNKHDIIINHHRMR